MAQGFSPASIAALKGCATTRLWWERLAFRGQRDSWSGGNPVGSKYAVQVADRLRCILVHRIDLAALPVRNIELPEDAEGLVRLRNGNTFVYSSAPGGPVWLLLGDEPELRTVFAPGFGSAPRRGVVGR